MSGLNLTLLIGPAVPIPVPKFILDALTEVQIVTTAGETASGFELTFELPKNSPLETLFLLAGGSPVPIVRVVLAATLNGTPEALIDGVMTQHEVGAGSDPSRFALKIKGKDLTAVMDYIDFTGIPYPAMPPEARVALILAKYAPLGVIPLVIPSLLVDIPIPTDRIPTHQGKDLPYLRQLAEDAGYVFYLEPGPVMATSIAYWGPEVRVGAPQPALSYNMDALTTVESLSFRFSNESSTMHVVRIQEPLSKISIPIPVPDVSLLNPPLGLVPPIPNNFEPLPDISRLTPIQAALRGLAQTARASDAVTGDGTLDVLRYGHILKARRLVGVRGAGAAFDGLYYVKSVTHRIKRGEYKQQFSLVRNGLLSTVPTIPV